MRVIFLRILLNRDPTDEDLRALGNHVKYIEIARSQSDFVTIMRETDQRHSPFVLITR